MSYLIRSKNPRKKENKNGKNIATEPSLTNLEHSTLVNRVPGTFFTL